MTEHGEASWEQVTRATTEEEKAAIYRFRYTVYVEELNRELGGVDSVARTVRDAVDELPGTVHLYIGKLDEILGVMRVEPWAPGEVPPPSFAEYSMDAIPGIEDLPTAHLGRLMVRPAARGRRIVPSLLRFAYELLTQEHDTRLAFGSCRPGLVAHYKRLGFRTYSGRLIHDTEGIALPILMMYDDPGYFERSGAPMADLARARHPTGDVSAALAPLFEERTAPCASDPERVWSDLQAELVTNGVAGTSFLDDLDDAVVRKLAAFGVVVAVPADTLITREGHVERELFIVLEGTFEAFSGARVFSQMTRGEVFGEVAFFLDSGARSASVRSVTQGRLVVLRRSVLAELARVEPAAAHTLLFNLARVLADRVARLSEHS